MNCKPKACRSLTCILEGRVESEQHLNEVQDTYGEELNFHHWKYKYFRDFNVLIGTWKDPSTYQQKDHTLLTSRISSMAFQFYLYL